MDPQTVIVQAPTFIDQIVPFATAVATAVAILATTLFPVYLTIRNRLEALKLAGEARSEAIDGVKKDVAAQGAMVEKLEVNTNSMKDALVEATRAGNLAQGNLAGRAELKAEQDAGKDKPQSVEIVNPKPVPVKVEK